MPGRSVSCSAGVLVALTSLLLTGGCCSLKAARHVRSRVGVAATLERSLLTRTVLNGLRYGPPIWNELNSELTATC